MILAFWRWEVGILCATVLRAVRDVVLQMQKRGSEACSNTNRVDNYEMSFLNCVSKSMANLCVYVYHQPLHIQEMFR